ncbi:MAG: hypothetical protein ACOYK8_00085 [Alphaproteobacteria bacterium]
MAKNEQKNWLVITGLAVTGVITGVCAAIGFNPLNLFNRTPPRPDFPTTDPKTITKTLPLNFYTPTPSPDATPKSKPTATPPNNITRNSDADVPQSILKNNNNGLRNIVPPDTVKTLISNPPNTGEIIYLVRDSSPKPALNDYTIGVIAAKVPKDRTLNTPELVEINKLAFNVVKDNDSVCSLTGVFNSSTYEKGSTTIPWNKPDANSSSETLFKNFDMFQVQCTAPKNNKNLANYQTYAGPGPRI